MLWYTLLRGVDMSWHSRYSEHFATTPNGGRLETHTASELVLRRILKTRTSHDSSCVLRAGSDANRVSRVTVVASDDINAWASSPAYAVHPEVRGSMSFLPVVINRIGVYCAVVPNFVVRKLQAESRNTCIR